MRRQPFQPDRSTADVYRPYNSAANPAARRFPDPRSQPGASGAQWRADPYAASGAGMLTSTHIEAIHRRRNGFSLFHDGNVGHLWRGEVLSLLGESVLGVGVVIWLAALTGSLVAVLAAVLALGLPTLIVGPIGATFENAREPGGMLVWLGRARVIAALCVVGMHFITVYPLLYFLLFIIGLCGRLRQALRVSATRACLAPGEIELVTNDLYIGSSVALVVGPLLAALLYLLLGDRLILVGLGAALFFLLASNADGFLDALPEKQRGFLLATPVGVAPDEATRDDLLRAARTPGPEKGALAEGEDAEISPAEWILTPEEAELALPEWYQQGPTAPTQALADIREGAALAGGRAPSATALLALLALALVGGGLSVVEVFFITSQLNLPPLYLGVVISLEAGGMALGALLASRAPFSALGSRLTLVGLALTGVALALFALTALPPITFLAALGMGVANALAVTGARQTLRAGRDGAERRAVSGAEASLTTLAGLLGALLFTGFAVGFSRLHVRSHEVIPGLPLSLILVVAGLGLVLIALMLFVRPGLRERERKLTRAELATRAHMPGVVAKADPNASVVGALWDGGEGGDDAYAESAEYDEYEDDGYDDARGYTDYTGAYRARYDDDDYDDGDYDDEPPARGGRRPPPSPRDRRNRW